MQAGARLDDAHEWFRRVSGAVKLPELSIINIAGEERVRGDEDSAHSLDRRGREGDLRAARAEMQLLNDLSCVPMAGGSVGANLAAPVSMVGGVTSLRSACR